MLALIKNDEVVAEVSPRGWYRLPNGDFVVPQDGWSDGEFTLREIQPSDPVPPGREVMSLTVEMVDGQPKYVAELRPLDLDAYAAERRWQKEVGGIVVGGVPIATDDRSKTMIVGARVKADSDPAFTTSFKGADGVFVTIDAATIIAISDAVLAHVAACFALENAVLSAIAAGEITTTAEIDTAFA